MEFFDSVNHFEIKHSQSIEMGKTNKIKIKLFFLVHRNSYLLKEIGTSYTRTWSMSSMPGVFSLTH